MDYTGNRFVIRFLAVQRSEFRFDKVPTFRRTLSRFRPATFFKSSTFHSPLRRSSANNSGYFETSSRPRGVLSTESITAFFFSLRQVLYRLSFVTILLEIPFSLSPNAAFSSTRD
ncbi:hypothetical protein WH47_11660 [Habropoda laboriosa]|uniref:Uncharacterized protein n=1 Tax=Habropoda laboriosa TaxID=597456 RepID=A0A0L7R9P8_9HYME|nr:hypothetical protein WH47_11660 [Habropoda laboriosa]